MARLTLLTVTLSLSLPGTASPGHFLPHPSHLSLQGKVDYFQRSLRKDTTAIRWLQGRQAPRTLERTSELGWFRAALRWHRSLLANARSKLTPPNDWAEWTCIHQHEGATNANTGNGYYGGLQQDIQFQRTYGADFLARWGTADHWPVWAQVTAARRARDSGRGYSPWPNTARACGQL